MDATTLLLVLGIVLAVMLVLALVARVVLLRPLVVARMREVREVIAARDVFGSFHYFSLPVPAQRVIEAVEGRYGRTVPAADADFYVYSTIYAVQVILRYGHRADPHLFSARIDFDTPDPASGIVAFYDADIMSPGTEAAARLCAEFTCLLDELVPGTVLEARDEHVVTIAPPDGPPRPPTSHRRR